MRLLADENTHRIVVERLCQAGFDVEWIKQSSPGALDRDILHRPDIGLLVFITNDRDFGDLIFKQQMPRPYAALYTRLPHLAPHVTADRLIAFLERGVTEGQMIIFTKDGERMKPFPDGA